jgi:hypothetical protein
VLGGLVVAQVNGVEQNRHLYKPLRILYSSILTIRHYYAVGKPPENLCYS